MRRPSSTGCSFAAFGLLAGAAVPIVLSLPSALIGTVAGLANDRRAAVGLPERLLASRSATRPAPSWALAVAHVERLALWASAPPSGPWWRASSSFRPGLRPVEIGGRNRPLDCGPPLIDICCQSPPLLFCMAGMGANVETIFRIGAQKQLLLHGLCAKTDGPVKHGAALSNLSVLRQLQGIP